MPRTEQGVHLCSACMNDKLQATQKCSMNLCNYLSRICTADPHRVLTICNGRRCTAADMAARVAAISASLRSDLAVQPGDRVLLAAVNSDSYLEMMLAVFAAGAYLAPINWRWSIEVSTCDACWHPCTLAILTSAIVLLLSHRMRQLLWHHVKRRSSWLTQLASDSCRFSEKAGGLST